MMRRENIGRKNVWDQRNGMVMDFVGWGKDLGILENCVILVKDRLNFEVQKGCLNCLNEMELENDARMTFFE